jgi:hypothetical protein
MIIDRTIENWHRLVNGRDIQGLDGILDDNVVFHSPIVHTPQEGKEISKFYLTAAFQVLANEHFRYVREVLDDRDAVLEFVTEIDGIQINGVDMIRCNDEARIVDFKVMIRPLKAVNLLHKMMAQMLESMKEA